MLRAIAGYFFGGMNNDESPAQDECETQEVKDWLVVNMPNRPVENVDLDDAVNLDESGLEIEEDDGTFAAFTAWVNASQDRYGPEDEKPSTESLSLTPYFDTTSDECEEDDTDDFSALNRLLERSRVSITYQHYMVNSPKDIVMDFEEDSEDTEFEERHGQRTRVEELIKEFEERHEQRTRVEQLIQDWKESRGFKYYAQEIRKDINSPESQRILEHLGVRVSNGSIHSIRKFPPFPKPFKKQVAKSPAVTCHPVYTSPTYVNHRNATLPTKTDLMQRIKELEPEQQATQRALKTHITRGQTNRQNKNYIYDTSTKKNRRKNLQRNHSRANNNRKC